MLSTTSLRHLFRCPWVAVVLLWAALLQGEKAVAYAGNETASCGQETAPLYPDAETDELQLASQKEINYVGLIKQQIPHEATVPLSQSGLQTAAGFHRFLVFNTPINEVIPACATSTQGPSFISLIAPLIIQPNAP